MNNNGLPDSKEWSKIVDDAFSSTEQHDFSLKYELKKAEIQKGITMSKTTNYVQRRYAGMVAAAAAIVIAVPVSVYAFSNGKNTVQQTEVNTTEAANQQTTAPESTTLSGNVDDITGTLSVAKGGEYRYILNFKPTDESLANTQKYAVDYTYLPEGFSQVASSASDNYITPSNGIFEPRYFRVSAESPVNEKIDNIINHEKIDEDNVEAYIFYRNSDNIDSAELSSVSSRVVYVHFKGTNFIANIYASDDVSDDDLRSMIKGMELVDSDSENSSQWTANDYPVEMNSSSDTTSDAYSVDMLNKLNIRDTVKFDINLYEKGVKALELTLNNAWIQDNFDGINTDICGQPVDFSEYLSSDGKIHDTVNWIKYGDGVNTLDETVKTEDVELKVVVLDLTYTNNSSFDFINNYDNGGDNNALVICPEIHNFPNNTIKNFFAFTDALSPYNTIPINNNSIFSIKSDTTTSKYAIDIPAGKSTNVRIALLVRADQLDDTYIDLLGYGCENVNDYINKDYFFPVKSVK